MSGFEYVIAGSTSDRYRHEPTCHAKSSLTSLLWSAWMYRRGLVHHVVSAGDSFFASVSALSFHGISQCPEIHSMDVSMSFWLCSLLAVVSMSTTIGCVCGGASGRWFRFLIVSLWIWLCYSRTGDLGCHIHWLWFVKQSVLPLVLHHSCYNAVRTLHSCLSARWIWVLYHGLIVPPHSVPIHQYKHPSLCKESTLQMWKTPWYTPMPRLVTAIPKTLHLRGRFQLPQHYVQAQIIDYRVIDDHQLGTNASCQ